MKKFIPFIFLFYITQDQLLSQSKESQYELGMNLANIITATFNIDRTTEVTDPFTFLAKRKNTRSYTRFGAYLYLSKSTEFLTSSDIEIDEKEFGFKVGKEWRKLILAKLELTYGVDIPFEYASRKSIANVFPSEITTEDRIYSTGLSPYVGLNYHLGKYVYLAIESNLSGKINFAEVKRINTGSPSKDFSYRNWSIRHNLPQSIYIFIKF